MATYSLDGVRSAYDIHHYGSFALFSPARIARARKLVIRAPQAVAMTHLRFLLHS